MYQLFEHIRGHTIFGAPLGPNSVILDLGANRGDFAREMSERYGGSYYLVEANPVLADSLVEAGQFPVTHCAVTAETGSVRLHVARNDEGSSILPLPRISVHNAVLERSVEVRASNLESILAGIPAARIDLVKMDIEGAEVEVLTTLRRSTLHKIGQMTVEFHSDPAFGFNLRRGVERVIRRIRSMGFVCLDFSYQTRRDVLFINQTYHNIPRLYGALWEYRHHPPKYLQGMQDLLPSRLKLRLLSMFDWKGL